MKTRLLGGILALLMFAANGSAGPRDAQWKQVEEAVNHGLPKTAIEHLDPIIAAALADKSYPEAIKGISRKIALEGGIEGGKAEEKITRMQAEMEKAPVAMKPAMEAILAHWYWQYFQQNRWKFMQRTQAGTASGPDLETWDLARILAEVGRHFTAALADEAVLKSTSVADYDELITQGSMPDNYRPTMFDFLTYEALNFYQTGEQGVTVSEDDFEIPADSPIFGRVAEFAKWSPETTDTDSPKLKAIKLYQALLKFHQSDSDRAAFYDADLARLTFGHNVATGEAKQERYNAALERFIAETAKHEVSARALAALAAEWNSSDEPAKARQIAQRGVAAFPRSAGGALCANLINQIEAKSAQLDTEYVWNAPWPTLDVTYRNVTKVYFRAVSGDFIRYLTQRQWGFGYVDENLSKELLGTQAALEWEAELPPTKDYKQRTEKLPAPASLKPGFYFIIASHDRAFGKTDNQLSIASIWVSDLALIVRTRSDGKASSGFVLKANGGEPVADATVRLWQQNREGWKKEISPVKTDKNGQFQFTSKNGTLVMVAEFEAQAVSSNREVNSYGGSVNERENSQTVFFTDRAIYRPGQTINYKGVTIRYDQNAGKYSVRAGAKITVVFNDANGQEIARATQKTNDYGSFNGTFTAPRDRLMGRMMIQVLDQTGAASISVEEYKRPKFQVELNAPKEAAKLGAVVDVTGKATAYTGSAIGGAKVKWRVQRAVQLPYWCWWMSPPASKAIAHGTAMTEADGTFKIQFSADPDRTVRAKNEPVFRYTLNVDVVDTTGETRSGERTLQAGYTALQASLSANEWQTTEVPVEFTLGTSSLDGDPQSAKGTLTIQALKQPARVERAPLQQTRYWRLRGDEEPKADPTNPDSWELGKTVAEKKFTTDEKGSGKLALQLGAGIYRASLETKDRFGKTVTARRTVEVVDPSNQHYGIKLPNLFSSPDWSVEPGEKFTALWGTGYETGRAFVELECNGKLLKSYWTASARTQELVEQAVTEEMRGGLTVSVTYLRENRAYLNQRVVEVPWSNKDLTVKWESFRSKLEPGQKETWTAVVTGPDAKRSAAEMVATLYDASLDQYLPHDWMQKFGVFRSEVPRVTSSFQNAKVNFQANRTWQGPQNQFVNWSYRTFLPEITAMDGNDEVVMLSAFAVAGGSGRGRPMAMRASLSMAQAPAPLGKGAEDRAVAAEPPQQSPAAPKPDLSKVTARKNLNETAFFFPQLIANADGVVKLVFTMPEALTEWKFMGFAHDKQLRAGFLTDKAVTSKDLMVEPNPPRFVRENDAIEFTVKVSNQTEQPQSGTVKLTFADAASQQSRDTALTNKAPELAFDVPAKQSRTYSWHIAVPDGMDFLTYKAVAASAKASDGEEGFLPVLSRRVLVTESLPLPIRGKTTKPFEFKKLIESGGSDTLKQQSLTVQMTSQPAWYAVMALPYLMEYPHECSEQVFNRVYANALARHIANSDPKVRRIFELWKNTPALDSPLEKNQEIKSVMIEETPWLRAAKNESQSRRNVGMLFDANRLDEESARGLRTLADRQLGDGLWSWFPGGRSSEYISLYITTGFGRLRHLGVEIDTQPAIKSLAALDAWIGEHYQRILKLPKPENYTPNYSDALYLYGRSFFLKDQPIATEQKAAVDFFLEQARKFWVQLDSRQSQAHLALALQRFGDKETPQAIMKSLKERSISNEEVGMYWRDSGQGWWWYRAPIETQAMMIEAFAEVARDDRAVEDCKVWLLKQKQTQDWKTTKATADAIYGLLLRGNDLLASDALVEVALDGTTIKPEKVEAGTGFYEQKFVRAEIKPAMGHITVKKVDDGVSWGSVHWQYLEDIAKVTPHEGTPLKLKKALFIKETTGKGQLLKPVTGAVSVGDELVVRIELKTDRDMEFVHLKDQRGSGTEPVNVLSQYKYQDGLGYYESTRDTASHFFIERLPRGTYVFEYSTRVQLKGSYQTGLAEIQCMYAPEFNSHSESIALEVK